ncbi:hypothetical protein [Spirosoma sp.]|uniref:hypothetical protein n=1 Tax=Spirosoma sp. TaxID=1899569 RepID=UPI003B3A5EB2
MSESTDTALLFNRGQSDLRPGYYADIVIFDPATIADKATFVAPFHYATGVQHVLINNKLVLKYVEHIAVFTGRAPVRKK